MAENSSFHFRTFADHKHKRDINWNWSRVFFDHSILMLTPLTTVGRSAFRAIICDCNSCKFGSALCSRSSSSDGLRLTCSIKLNIQFSSELREKKNMFAINWNENELWVGVCVCVCDWNVFVCLGVLWLMKMHANLLVMCQVLRMHQLMLVLVLVLVLMLLLLMVVVRVMRWLEFYHFMFGQAVVFGRMNRTEWRRHNHTVNIDVRLVRHVRLHVFVRRIVYNQIGWRMTVDRRWHLMCVRHRRQTVMGVLWWHIMRIDVRCWRTVLICDRWRNLCVNGIWHWR